MVNTGVARSQQGTTPKRGNADAEKVGIHLPMLISHKHDFR